MRILVVSDSHLFDDDLDRITDKYYQKVDFMIHCGDSSLSIDNELIQKYDIVVKGNHDDAPFEKYSVYDDIIVTHGHFYHVYAGYDELIELCKENQCLLCFHGHTHVPTYQIHDGIHFINPGSLMMNRASYGYGTYAIVEYDHHEITVKYYHHKTYKLCPSEIIDEGLELLNEFKKIV